MFYDFIISGGGLAGILACNILRKLGFSVYIFDKAASLRLDQRTTTISYGAKLFLKKFGIWQELEKYATPILDIYTYEFGRTSYLHFDSVQDGAKSPMGYVVPNKIIQDILYRGAGISYNASYRDFYSSDEKARVIFTDEKIIDGRFLIIAEGRNSNTARKARSFSSYYGQTSIICNLESEEEHRNIAREIFLPTGPLALLPLQEKNQFSLIWSIKFELASSIRNSDESVFLEDVSRISNIKFCKIISDRVSYDLSVSFGIKNYKKNTIFIGDAIHAIHPIAGQGFNLTMYDLDELFTILEKYGIENLNKFLSDYSRQSFKRNIQMLLFTDLLVRGFSNNSRLMKFGRNLAIDIINGNDRIRNFFIKRAMYAQAN